MVETINELVRLGLVEINKKKVGCCFRDVVVFTDNSKEYLYNSSKPLSKILHKKVSSLKYTKPKSMPSEIVRNTLKNAYKSSVAITKVKKIYDEIRERRVRKALTKRYKPDFIISKSALSKYSNSINLDNIKLKGLKGLSYIKYQYLKIKDYLINLKGVKVLVDVEFLITRHNGESANIHTRSRVHTALTANELQNILQKMIDDITIDIEVKATKGTGFTINSVKAITIHVNKYNPSRGETYIPLPMWVTHKRACINIQNKDKFCFKYSVLCGILEVWNNVNHPERVSHYRNIQDENINWDISFPPENSDIDVFENNNSDISVNVYRIGENQTILAHRLTKKQKTKYHIDLLLITSDGEENNRHHYVFIKDFGRLMNSQVNKNHDKKYYCKSCLHAFKTNDGLNKHLEFGCHAIVGTKTIVPSGLEYASYVSREHEYKAPFVIYADFECLTRQIQTASSSHERSYTDKVQAHEPSGFAIYIVSSIKEIKFDPVVYRNNDKEGVAKAFIQEMQRIQDMLMKLIKSDKGMNLTDEEETMFQEAEECHICKKTLGDDRVRDHCHLSGKFRGAAHNKCNLNFNHKHIKIPVFFHNLKNYDSHLIVSSINQLDCKKNINVIAQNSEKFITFGFNNLQFKDSYSFLSSSLDKLVKLNKYKEKSHLNNWVDKFKHSKTNKYIKDNHDLDLLTDKGNYPYDYMNHPDKFNEQELPPIEDFYSLLTETGISNEEYEKSKYIWRHFNIKNMGEYHDLYMLTDVLLLADIFENFRDEALLYYGLDPAHYYTLPGYSWDAMLKMTGVSLEILNDVNMYEMIEQGIRGGMTQVSLKHVKANNKYMKSYDVNKPSVYLKYLDANNLYGHSMSQYLPYANFKWCDINENDILNYDEGSDVGYILDVDLEYPKHLHDLHNDYPMAPELMKIKAEYLSEVSKEIYGIYHNNKNIPDEQVNKLVLNLNDKFNYITHIGILKYYLEQGIVLKKIHRCIRFSQKPWLKPWIDFNTSKRANAKTDFEKDLFKLMNNAVFGKTMENVKNHIDFELITCHKRFEKVVNKPNFKHAHIINENLVGVEKTKEVVVLKKPIYVGFSILELSKLHMYKFYYDVLKTKYNEKVRLCYTDTDSYILSIQTEDAYKDFCEMGDYFDYSNYPKDHENYDVKNNKKIGYFKDENGGEIFNEYVGLKPKMLSKDVEDKESNTAKGLSSHKVRKCLTMKDYRETLYTNKVDYMNFRSIRSYGHAIFTIECNKLGLSSFDNKRYWLDNVNSLAYGHYRIAESLVVEFNR